MNNSWMLEWRVASRLLRFLWPSSHCSLSFLFSKRSSTRAASRCRVSGPARVDAPKPVLSYSCVRDCLLL